MTIYKLTCRPTGKSYVGATRLRLEKRFANHRQSAKQSSMKGRYLIAQAIRDHGWESFDIEVVGHANSLKELGEKEYAAIVLFGTMHPAGYNQRAGGTGGFNGPVKNSKPAWNKGGTHRPDSCAKIAESLRGGQNPRARAIEYLGVRYDCVESAAKAHNMTRAQIQLRISKGLGVYLTPPRVVSSFVRPPKASDEARRKMSDAHSGAKHYRARRILVDGVEYPSIKDAEGVSGYTRQQLKLKLRRGSATYLSESRYIAAPKEA